MSSAWAKIAAPVPVNLQDIMSEEVAKDLQSKEDKMYLAIKVNDFDISPTMLKDCEFEASAILPEEEDMLKNDAEIAKMLQHQFDKEHDEMLERSEKKFNGTNKVSISFTNYRRAPQNCDFESDSEEEELEDIRDRKDWDRFDTVLKEFASIPSRGYMIKDGTMVTKHDVAMSGVRNACKFMSFPPEFETGDGAGFDLQLSNKVFNSLKMHSKHEQARRHKIRDRKEDHATAIFGVDQYTRLILYKMINSQLLERVNGVISIGKEAAVLHANSDPQYTKCALPKECCIKVFKTTLSEFKQREKYIKDDSRFRHRIGNQTSRKIIQMWAEKEMRNLVRLQRAGIPCPEVVALKHHVLVMSFIGKDHKPAPKLKYARLKDLEYLAAYNEVVQGMKTLYEKANLIHADLSEYNILWYQKTCYFIDVSQSVEPSHENAFYFLMRDCENITHFFSQKGVPEVATAEELFQDITGHDFRDKVTLLALEESFKMKPHLVGRPGMESTYHFDSAWERSKAGGTLEEPSRSPTNVENIAYVDSIKA